jgi:putative ABC transport system permease protein
MAESLLRKALPPGTRFEGIAGDLREEYARVRSRRAAGTANLWYWANVLLLSIQYSLPTWCTMRKKTGTAPRARGTSSVRLESLLQDIQVALRVLLKRPGFTAVVVATFAVGIGGTVAMFSAFNTAFLVPLPYDDPDRLVFGTGRIRERTNVFLSAWDFFDYREQNDVFDALELMRGFDISVTVTGGDRPERISEREISTGFFSMLGVTPIVGRDFVRDEEEVNAARVALLSYGFWQNRFGGDAGAVGGPLVIDDRTHTIVGVLPATMDFMRTTDVFTAMRRDTPWGNARGPQNWYAIGRLSEGVSIAQAQEQVNVIGDRLAAEYPETNTNRRMHLTPFHERLVSGARPMFLVLAGAVGFVLLVACANVGGLLLARGVTRSGEMAVRSALGASRTRIVRQLLTESVLIAAAGGLLGLFLSHWLLQVLRQLAPAGLPGSRDFRVDIAALGIALAFSIITGLLVGIVPAIRGANTSIAGQLSSGRRISDSRSGARLRGVLVVAQVTLSLVLLIGSGLLMRSFWMLQAVDPGFDAGGVLTAEVALPRGAYQSPAEVSRFYRDLTEQVAERRGVVAAAAISRLPIARPGGDWPMYAEDNPPADQSQRASAYIRSVTDRYFETMRIPLIGGRGLNAEDTPDAPVVAVVDEAWVDRFLPGEDPVGRNLVLGSSQQRVVRIVGLVGRVHGSSLQGTPYPTVYFSFNQWTNRTMNLVVRASFEPTSLASIVRGVVTELDHNVPVSQITTMTDVISNSIAQPRRTTLLLGVFATVALLLSTLGLYGVLAFFVNHRVHELGVRIALGAGSAKVLRLVLLRGMALVAIGLVLGISGAAASTRFLQSMLFGVGTTDVVTFVVVSLVLVAVAAGACLIPAMKAARVDPLTALRAE